MNPTETLCAIEMHAARANVQELRILVQEVRSMRSILDEDELDYAEALLLKLDRLMDEQMVCVA